MSENEFMKILIVKNGFFPGEKYGGPPISINNFCSLMKECECYIVTRDHDMFETKRFENIHDGWNDRCNSKVLYLSDKEFNKKNFERVITEIEPDILYLQSVFQSCVISCILLAQKHCVPILLAPRGELCAGAFNIKRWKKFPYIKIISILGLVRNIYWQSTSDEESLAIKKLVKVDDENIIRLDNIPSIPKKNYPKKEKKTGEGRFVFLSRIHPKKNLLFAISLFKEVKGNAEFDIYGPIEDEMYWKQCQEEIKNLPENIKVKYKGLIRHDQVHETFFKYDVFLFPTLSENYGHVIAESLSVGTPVIISDQTPWNDVNQYGAGMTISLKDKANYIKHIEEIINLGDDYIKMSASAKNYFEKKCRIDYLHSKYLKALRIVTKRND